VGGVLISEATFAELGTRAAVEAVPPMHVKGKRDPVRAYVLERLVMRTEGET
jgi:class 3 adenylate cyclase